MNKKHLVIFSLALFFVLTVIFSPSAQAAAPTTGLVAHWKFDEGSGTTAGDSAGTNNGTLVNGPTFATGKVGQALSFDGSNDYVQMSSGAGYSNTQAHTFAAWVKINGAFGSNYGWILSADNQGILGGTSLVVRNNGQPAFFYKAGENFVDSNTALTQSVWAHIATVYNGSGSVTFYLNGVADGTRSTGATTWGSTSLAFRMGVWSVGQHFFPGSIDDVRVYNRALSAQEISDIYNDT